MTEVSSEYQGSCAEHGAFVGRQIAGPFPESRPIQFGCPECAASRKVEREKWEQDQAKAADERRKQEVAQSRVRAGIPPRFDDRTLDSFVADTDAKRRALAACRRLVDAVKAWKSPQSIIMSGLPGTGKTHLSCGIVNEVLPFRSVKRIDLPDMIRNIRATWARNAELTETEVLDFYGGVDLLVIEEVGTGSGSDDERSRVFQVLNRRYEAMLPTVIVTNLSIAELSKELGDRVIDRLREGGGSLVVFDWPSHRKDVKA